MVEAVGGTRDGRVAHGDQFERQGEMTELTGAGDQRLIGGTVEAGAEQAQVSIGHDHAQEQPLQMGRLRHLHGRFQPQMMFPVAETVLKWSDYK